MIEVVCYQIAFSYLCYAAGRSFWAIVKAAAQRRRLLRDRSSLEASMRRACFEETGKASDVRTKSDSEMPYHYHEEFRWLVRQNSSISLAILLTTTVPSFLCHAYFGLINLLAFGTGAIAPIPTAVENVVLKNINGLLRSLYNWNSHEREECFFNVQERYPYLTNALAVVRYPLPDGIEDMQRKGFCGTRGSHWFAHFFNS